MLGPIELRLDVSLVGDNEKKPEYAIIQEVQNSCAEDDLKRIRGSWPEYVTSLRKRLGCQVVLLAYCPDERTAAAIGQPVETGHPGFVFAPVTYWPGKLPAVTDPVAAVQWPELVLLSVPGHVRNAERRRVLEMVPQAVAGFGQERGLFYYDYVCARLPEAARLELEKIMSISAETYRWESDFALRHQAIGHDKGLAEGRAEGHFVGRIKGRAEGRLEGRAEGRTEGKAEGEATSILTVLEARGIEVDTTTRERVLTCSDLEQLSRWLIRAVQATTATEIFDED